MIEFGNSKKNTKIIKDEKKVNLPPLLLSLSLSSFTSLVPVSKFQLIEQILTQDEGLSAQIDGIRVSSLRFRVEMCQKG